MQSLFVLQVVRQVPLVLHRYGEQLDVVWAPHMPAPVQTPAAVKVDPVHDEAAHCTDVEPCVHCPVGAAVPAGNGAQLPIPLRLQAWQVPQLGLPQQTPSTQLPLMHWLAIVQVCPFGFSAQLRVVPDP
jgi:hypothetical protein